MDSGARRVADRLFLWVPLALVALGTITYTVWLLTGADQRYAEFLDTYVYSGVVLLAGVVCLARAARRTELRGAWVAFGLGLLAWGVGNVCWTELQEDGKIPYPSWADAGYLASLPCFFTGIALMIKHRIGRFTLASWLDGLVGALAAAALCSALLAPALVGLTKGDIAAVATNLAYPVGDILLIAMITGALIVGGVRGAAPFILIGVGIALWAGGDVVYLYQAATTGWKMSLVDSLWLGGALAIAAAACVSMRGRHDRRSRYQSRLLFPAIFTLSAGGVLVYDHFSRLHEASVWLAGATIVAVVVRLAISFRENDRLVAALHGEAVTDPLTGLGNRRQLLDDLEAAFDDARTGEPLVFGLFDLDGFKSYNDTFGHPAGDSLLRRLGVNLATSVGARGAAYRLGGDEFCVLVPAEGRRVASVIEMVRAALTERGEGFEITASGGGLIVPDDAYDAGDALRQADKRMYFEKTSRGDRAAAQTRDLLLRILRAREPDLGDHLEGVAMLASGVGHQLSLAAEELDIVTRAAELHDIGKIAIPDEILNKPEPLDDAEWELMRKHTLIGERILDAAPAMSPVARLVRSSHERWDGAGYPDKLAGGEIPLGSRIILVCDAFEAMTAARPYQAPMPAEAAVAELRANAGSQFDPQVVEAFCRLIEGDVEPNPSPQHATASHPPLAR